MVAATITKRWSKSKSGSCRSLGRTRVHENADGSGSKLSRDESRVAVDR
jgi:hypothetical protein